MMNASPVTPRDDNWIADQMLRIVQLVFGVVIASSLTTYKDVVVNPLSHSIAALALLAVYMTAVLSWMGWHATMARHPYVCYTGDRRHMIISEHLRVFSDLAVVILYAYVLFGIDSIKMTPSADITSMLLGYPLIFAFYLVSGALRIKQYDRRASRRRSLTLGLVAFLALVLIYGIARSLSPSSYTWINAATLLGMIALTVGYRVLSERERRRPREAQAGSPRRSGHRGKSV